MTERSVVQFGNTRIPFEVRRSERRRTVSLLVDDAGDLLVTAPEAVSIARLDAVVRTKAPWVVESVKRTSDRAPAPPVREFVTGETIRYLGKQYRLRRKAAKVPRTVLVGGWLEVRGGVSVDARAEVAGWLRTRAEAVLPSRLRAVWKGRGAAPALRIVEPKRRWGSCDSRGVLRINWRVVQAPVSIIDYVLAHEVTHLSHAEHGRGFWSALGRVMPDYDERRERLRRIGPELLW